MKPLRDPVLREALKALTIDYKLSEERLIPLRKRVFKRRPWEWNEYALCNAYGLTMLEWYRRKTGCETITDEWNPPPSVVWSEWVKSRQPLTQLAARKLLAKPYWNTKDFTKGT